MAAATVPVFKIGVGITSRNRSKTLDFALAQWYKYSDRSDRIELTLYVVVDDQSPESVAKYLDVFKKFEPHHINYHICSERHGVAAAKNRCLDFLRKAGTRHIFLADDDIWPTRPAWWEPFLSFKARPRSRLKPNKRCYSLQYLDRRRVVNKRTKILRQDINYIYTNDAAGCINYIDNDRIPSVRFDERYGIYGYEHIDFCKRAAIEAKQIHSFVAPVGVDNYFYSLDIHHTLLKEPLPEGYGDKHHHSCSGEDLKPHLKAALDFHNTTMKF